LKSCRRKCSYLLFEEDDGLGEDEPPWTSTVEEETKVDLAKMVQSRHFSRKCPSSEKPSKSYDGEETGRGIPNQTNSPGRHLSKLPTDPARESSKVEAEDFPLWQTDLIEVEGPGDKTTENTSCLEPT